MLEFLIDNIFAMFGGRVFQQTVGIHAKHSKYVVNQKLEHVDDISFRELFGRIRVGFFFTK
jgi:hypothetical protein